MSGLASIDREALLVALVLAPATYSRNRFFALYTDPDVRRVRSRAALVRSIVRHVSRVDPTQPGEILSVEPTAQGRVELTYVVPALGLRRTATLEPIELSLVRFDMARASGKREPLASDDPDRLRIEAALQRLAPLAFDASDSPGAVPPSARPV
jgi:hypothetical protein